MHLSCQPSHWHVLATDHHAFTQLASLEAEVAAKAAQLEALQEDNESLRRKEEALQVG